MASSAALHGGMELMHSLLPTIPLDKGVASANTGVLLLDALPLLTMLPCVPTLGLYLRNRRYGDFAAFGLGFLLAVVYHVAHMHPLGLGEALVLGVPGPVWRTLDILMAQTLLARTLGHALGVHTSLLAVICNLLFPTVLMAYTHAVGRLTLGVASKVLLFVMLAALAGKATVEGWDTLPQYCPRRGKRALACFMLGFLCFPMPELFPRQYWLFHSLWHVFLAQGYHDLYHMLEAPEQPHRRQQRLKQRPRRQHSHGSWLLLRGGAPAGSRSAEEEEWRQQRRLERQERRAWRALLALLASNEGSGTPLAAGAGTQSAASSVDSALEGSSSCSSSGKLD